MMQDVTNWRVLVVEDDVEVARLVKDALEHAGFDVVPFFDGPQVINYVKEYGLPHIALIDLTLPKMHGFDLSRELKNLGDVPIIFISTEGESETVIEGLNRYAEDYVVKPFDYEVLAARVRRVLTRVANFDYARLPVIRVDEHVSVDLGRNMLTVEGEQHDLTPTEARLLHILIRNKGRAVSSDTLIARTWPLEQVFEETLRVNIHRLRRKLEPDYRHPAYILTERNVGYSFIDFEPPDDDDSHTNVTEMSAGGTR